MSDLENTLWVEKYRPQSIKGYIGNQTITDKIKECIEQNDIPHFLFYGEAGHGKTTLAKIITNSIKCDVLYINASDENNVDTVRTKIKSYASTVGLQGLKVVILDEFDYMSNTAQAVLRNLMETYSKTCRFILTCNYIEKVLNPIKSRCQVFKIENPSKDIVCARLKTILKKEEITYKDEDLATIVENCYPDIRKCINMLQQSCMGGELVVAAEQFIETEYVNKIIDALCSKENPDAKYKKIKQIIADSGVKEFTPLYKEMYEECEKFAMKKYPMAVIAISESQYQSGFVMDKEICIMALISKFITDKY